MKNLERITIYLFKSAWDQPVQCLPCFCPPPPPPHLCDDASLDSSCHEIKGIDDNKLA